MEKTSSVTVLLAVLCAALAGCAGTDRQDRTDSSRTGKTAPPGGEPQWTGQRVLGMAELQPTQGNTAQGSVYFIEEPQGTRITGQIVGLTPGDHGFHIHENGDCSAPDASSAGGHFNPTGALHGGPRTSERHVGDLGNITAGPDGTAHISEVMIPALPFSGPSSVLGKALLVHANADDLRSQPSGDSGGRVACGVIRQRE
ncbi:MAG: superoxide dismutase family protein [Verrucomicrobiia bacterium]